VRLSGWARYHVFMRCAMVAAVTAAAALALPHTGSQAPAAADSPTPTALASVPLSDLAPPVQQAASDAISYCSTNFADIFGGVWLDMPANRAHIVLTDTSPSITAQISQHIRHPELVFYDQTRYTLQDLSALRDRIFADRDGLIAQGIEITSVGLATTTVGVYVLAIPPMTSNRATQILNQRYGGDAITVNATQAPVGFAPKVSGNIGTGDFFAAGFEGQWQRDEAIIPGFWGSLQTSIARNEPYDGASGGSLCPSHLACAGTGASDQRTVQYFDKGRMEDTSADYLHGGPKNVLTNGRLVVEMMRGQIQVGDSRYLAQPPAAIAIIGDAGSGDPTYADLANLPERDERTDPDLFPFAFDAQTQQWAPTQTLPTGISPQMLAGTRTEDPNGRYSQRLFAPFAEMMSQLSNAMPTIGLPITPMFIISARVAGVTTTYIAQAFERRVLLYDPTDGQVQFADVGMHYYQWRYGGNPAIATPS
jgi:hypothetical protein